MDGRVAIIRSAHGSSSEVRESFGYTYSPGRAGFSIFHSGLSTKEEKKGL